MILKTYEITNAYHAYAAFSDMIALPYINFYKGKVPKSNKRNKRKNR